MADTGWVSPGTVVSDDSDGTQEWSDLDNAKSWDGSDWYDFAEAIEISYFGNARKSEILKATNFNFSIPSRSTINGIEVLLDAKASISTGVSDNLVKLIKSNSSLSSADRSKSGDWSGSSLEREYGGSSDLWGESWNVSDINSANFGFALQVVGDTSTWNVRAEVYHIQMKVYYTESGGASRKNLILLGVS